MLIVLTYTILGLVTNPSNNRDWNLDQEILPYAVVEEANGVLGTEKTADSTGNLIHVKNIRNFSYTSTKEFTPNYYDKTFDISKLKRVYYIVEPFSGFKGSAHTFLSFEFEPHAVEPGATNTQSVGSENKGESEQSQLKSASKKANHFLQSKASSTNMNLCMYWQMSATL
jgi:hypothetical protein